MSDDVFLAVDLGASSGRVLAGQVAADRVELTEVHRFENGGVAVGERLYWDILALWQHVQDGLRLAAGSYGDRIRSVGVDTWGVDFGLLGRDDELLGNPRHYRDRHTHGVIERACARVGRDEIFARTGLQFMEFNTLFQLFALREADSPILEHATALLMIPDLFHLFLTGEKSNEATNVSTTQCFDPVRREWSGPLLESLGIPTGIFQPIRQPGTSLGTLRTSVAEETGLAGVQVVLPGTHDTASAVMAVPAQSTAADWCYISSGTWSLMGVEIAAPIINDRCRTLNFTNEGGVGGTVRLLKNIAGLWLVQECRRAWQLDGRDFSWVDLVAAAEASPPLVSLIDPDADVFVAPQRMPEAIADYCRHSGQPVPQDHGAYVRCALESLALRYRMVLQWLESLVGNRLETIHIVGGGTQNQLLCQMAADACQRRVVAGPVEATALGNVLVQTMAAGLSASVAEARQMIRRSVSLLEYEPRQTADWDAAYERFTELVGGADA